MAQRQTRRQWLAACTAAVGAVAGCAGSDSDDTTTEADTETSPTEQQTTVNTPGQDERIARLHEPGRTLAGTWSFENVEHSDGLRELLGKQGLVLEFDHWYRPDGPPAARLFGEEQGPGNYKRITDAGYIPQIVWLGPNAGAESGEFGQYAQSGERAGLWYGDVAGGMWDEEIREMAREIAAVDAPLFWVPFEEFTGGWRPAIDLQHNPPADFAMAWRRMWKIFQQEGATNAAWVIAPAHNIIDEGLDGEMGMETWWPGSKFVDYVGFDLYAATHKPEPASENIKAALDLFNEVSDEELPFLMNEIGVKPSYLETDSDLSPAEWTREAMQYMRNEDQVAGFNWWDFDGDTGVTETQSWEEPPDGLTDIGTALAEELEDDNFVETPSYGYNSIPEYDGLADRTPPTVDTVEAKSVTYTVKNTGVTVDGEIDSLPESAAIDLAADHIVRSEGVSISGGKVWVTYDDTALYLSAVVEDDVHLNEYQSSRNWDGDVVQLGVTGVPPSQASTYAEFNMSLSQGEETIFANPGVPGEGSLSEVTDAEAAFRRDDNGATIYEIALPWSLSQLPIDSTADDFGLAFGIADRDGDGSWEWLSWTDCEDGSGIMAQKDPTCFYRAALE